MASLTMSLMQTRPPCRHLSARTPARQQRRVICMAAPDLKTATEEAEKLAAELKQKRKEAEEASKKSQAAWEAVEKLTQGSGATGGADPLDVYCGDNPDADECRVYED